MVGPRVRNCAPATFARPAHTGLPPRDPPAGRANFLNLSSQCASRYLLHLDGNAYSAGLKYKLACGSLVLKVHSGFDEFYYPGLVPNEHFVPVKAVPNKHVERRMVPELLRLLEEAESPAGAARARRIAAAGQRFVREQLSEQGISCYWYVLLRHYVLLASADGALPVGPLEGVKYRARLRHSEGAVRSI